MPFTVNMPKLSPTMEEGTITRWHKKEGDKVEAGEILLEVATDKATVEYNALDEGFLRKILIPSGGVATVNQPIAIFTEKANESIAGYEPKGTPPKEAPKPKEETKGEMKHTPAPSMPQVAFQPESPLEDYQFQFPTSAIAKRIPASPLAKKLAKDKGLDLSTVKGTGPGGRVTSKDLDLAQSDQIVTFGRREMPMLTPGTFEEVPLSPMRKVIATRLQQAKMSIPHIYVHQEIDAEPLFHAREQLKTGNLKVSVNDFIIRAAALALREHPNCNSGFNAATQSIILFKTIDISVAVSVEGGLITPIIRHADYKNIGEISLEIKELAARARSGKLQEKEYKGGSFTISNMGMYGITDFCAIINPPQAAILAVGGIEECARVKNGQVVAGKKMHLVVSADHRVIDGDEAAKWLKSLQKYLENPALLTI
jgi:pyruvate dehydrogenase E2 component (dihydrolipoamide acetyltransferase)